MDRYYRMIIFVVAISISSAFCPTILQANNSENSDQITSQEQAAMHAAKLANEKCQKEFGESPFTPASYEAELVDSKWHWGRIEPRGTNGYSAKVEFNKDGSDESVIVGYSTDKKELQTIKIETKTLPENQIE
jgi:hypothetical protein